MTFPSVAPSFPNKLKSEDQTPDYAKVIKYLDDIQDDGTKRRLQSGTVKITILYMLILTIISISVIVVSNF